MIKFIINIIELYIIIKVLYGLGKFLFTKKMYGRKKKGKSIAGKIAYLLSNKIHFYLDKRIKQQKELTAQQQTPNNVIAFKKARA